MTQFELKFVAPGVAILADFENSAFSLLRIQQGRRDEDVDKLGRGADLEAPGVRERIQAQMAAVHAIQARTAARYP